MSAASYARDKETARTVAGVYVNPLHPLSKLVHAFRTWTGDRTLETWCEVSVNLTEGGAQTTDRINCQQCSEASFQATQRMLRGTAAPQQQQQQRAGAGSESTCD